jgi:phthalate 4,5-cis-dihydrodiol dehydrogenase
MSLSLADCAAMIEATERAGVAMVVGHSHSFDAPIAHARRLIASGAFGDVRMINALQFTDFIYRPRRPEELATAQGGGVIFNQAPHQIDNVRMIGGGRVRSVRAATGVFDPARPTEGAYSAFLTFESGAFASLAYSGYGHFDTDEFADWIAESGVRKDPAKYGAARRALAGVAAAEELALKNAQNFGGPRYAPPPAAAPSETRWHQHFGLLVASCDRGDLRPLPNGVMTYGDGERRFEPLAPPRVPREEVVDELFGAVFEGRRPLHDGVWAMATMEVCFALLQSAREGREIALSNQCGLPPGF